MGNRGRTPPLEAGWRTGNRPNSLFRILKSARNVSMADIHPSVSVLSCSSNGDRLFGNPVSQRIITLLNSST